MLIKLLELNGVQHVTSCLETVPSGVGNSDRGLTFYCHNEADMLTFVEALSYDDFKQRLKNMNPRIKFPEEPVRKALMSSKPTQASLAKEFNALGVRVLALEFVMPGTPVPLKWQWHLMSMDTGVFYRQLFVDAAATGKQLGDLVVTLTGKLCDKDKELAQFRREGFQLRRTTVKTKVFDVQLFNDVNGEVLQHAAAYRQLGDIFPTGAPSRLRPREEPSTPSTSSVGSSTSDMTSPGSSSSSAHGRKRQTLESNRVHLERKVRQRLQQPQMKFKNSQSSQEDALADWLIELNPNRGVKQIKKKNTKAPQVPVAQATTVKTEIDEDKPKAEAATVKTEIDEEKPKAEATTVKTEIDEEKAEDKNNDPPLTDSDQELNELRSILGGGGGPVVKKLKQGD